MISSNLVFDLGLDNEDDTSFYLAKGLQAVVVEANPELVEAGRLGCTGLVHMSELLPVW